MKFLEKLNKQWALLDEANKTQDLASDNTTDAAAPDPNAAPAPEAGAPAQVAPEG